MAGINNNTNTTNNFFLCLIVKFAVFSKFGNNTLWLNLFTSFSASNIIGGRTTTVEISPKRTPLLITRPISLPSPSCINNRTKNPAKVVSDEANIDAKVESIAFAIASFLFSFFFFFSTYLWYRKIE